MADSILYVAIANDGHTATSVVQKYLSDANEPHQGLSRLIAYLSAVLAGSEPARVYVACDDGAGTAGTCTITCTQANATVGETVTIGGVTFTIATTRTGANEVVAGASDATFGENVKDAINEHTLLRGLVTATDNDAGVVTLTCNDAGLHANLLVTSETGDAFAVTQITNGAEGSVASGGSLRAYSCGR